MNGYETDQDETVIVVYEDRVEEIVIPRREGTSGQNPKSFRKSMGKDITQTIIDLDVICH